MSAASADGTNSESATARPVPRVGQLRLVVEVEVREVDASVLAKTANRSTVGMLTEFGFLADAHRDGAAPTDLTVLAVRLARIPDCASSTRTSADERRAWSCARDFS